MVTGWGIDRKKKTTYEVTGQNAVHKLKSPHDGDEAQEGVQQLRALRGRLLVVLDDGENRLLDAARGASLRYHLGRRRR